MNEDFTFKNKRIKQWLFVTVLFALLLCIFVPPAFWLCGLGAVLLVIGQLANSARTNQWMSWQNEGSLNWFEGWAVSTGAVLILVPLCSVIIQSVVGN